MLPGTRAEREKRWALSRRSRMGRGGRQVRRMASSYNEKQPPVAVASAFSAVSETPLPAP